MESELNHMKNLLLELNSTVFIETFCDIHLICRDGHFSYYKAILALWPEWKLLLNSSNDSDTVYLPEICLKDFHHIGFKGVTEKLFGYTVIADADVIGNHSEPEEDLVKEGDCEAEEILEKRIGKGGVTEYLVKWKNYGEEAKSWEPVDNLGDAREAIRSFLKCQRASRAKKKELVESDDDTFLDTDDQYNVISSSVEIKDSKLELKDEVPFNTPTAEPLSYKNSERDPGCVRDNFDWPEDVPGPNFHSVGWRSDAFEVKGNRSVFRVLNDNSENLPTQCAFSVKIKGEGSDWLGLFNLRDFVNSGAERKFPVFFPEECENLDQTLSLNDLLVNCGYSGEFHGDSDRCVKIHFNKSTVDLKDLCDRWRKVLSEDCLNQELVGWVKSDRRVINWLKETADKTEDGTPVCLYCGFICHEEVRASQFETHIRRHLWRRRVCRQCDKHFTAGQDHVCEETEECSGKRSDRKQIFHCPEEGCSKTCNDKYNMKRHMLKVHNIEQEVVKKKCEFCSEMIAETVIKSHYAEAHKNEVLGCDHCDKTFPNPSKRQMHIYQMHSNKFEGFCDICQKDYKNLQGHMNSTHSKLEIPCDHCGKVFKHKKALESHMASVNGTIKKKQCPECDNFYVNLSSHIQRFHRGKKRANQSIVGKKTLCRDCQKYIKNELFEAHTVTCRGAEDQGGNHGMCNICGKEVAHLPFHQARAHGIRPHHCLLCNLDFDSYTTLNAHLRSAHFPQILDSSGFDAGDLETEDKLQREKIASILVEQQSAQNLDNKFHCNLCSKITDTNTYMINHMKFHLGFTLKKGPLSEDCETICSWCGKVVKQRQLTRHLNNCQNNLEVSETGAITTKQRQPKEIASPRKRFMKKIRLPANQSINEFISKNGLDTLNEDDGLQMMDQIEQQLQTRTIEATDSLENLTGGRTVWQFGVAASNSRNQVIETTISGQTADGVESVSFCRLCGKITGQNEKHICEVKKQRRIKKSLEPKPHCCSECGNRFKMLFRLRRHMKSAHQLVMMQECLICLTMVPDLYGHFASAHDNQVLTCDACDGKVFETPLKYATHLKDVHNTKKGGICDICQKQCKNLTRHNENTHSDQKIPCGHCDKIFRHPNSLEWHMRKVTGKMKIKKRQCQECNNFYVNLESHIKKVHRRIIKASDRFPKKSCDICWKQVKESTFDQHQSNCHLNSVENGKCNICNEDYRHLKNHMSRAHGIHHIICYLCSQTWPVMSELNAHLRLAHLPEILASNGFQAEDLLTEEPLLMESLGSVLLDKHSGRTQDEKFQCLLCSKQTITGVLMLQHMKHHLGFTRQTRPPREECLHCSKMVKSLETHSKFCLKQTQGGIKGSRDLAGQNIMPGVYTLPVTNNFTPV